MRIGLVDIDGHHFPNLALMKLSAWHKAQGDSVEFADPMFGRYDRVYMSKVFTFTADCSDIYHCEVIRGGTGFRDYTTILPEEIEHICPDYSLYGVDEAYGFLTRGCPNRCPWCIVPHKEGGHPVGISAPGVPRRQTPGCIARQQRAGVGVRIGTDRRDRSDGDLG